MNDLFKLTLALTLILSLTACSGPNLNDDNIIITISNEGVINSTDCFERNLTRKVIMLESKYCAHCEETLPDFKAACNENNIEPVILDLSKEEDREQMESYRINIQFTPTFIFNCEYFVGAKSKLEYVKLLENMKVDI